MLSGGADRTLRKEGAALIQLIDSSPIPLGESMGQRAWNGRIKGMKLHVVYDPHSYHPSRVDITQANINDSEIGRTIMATPGATYVFDKGYCSYAWWHDIDAASAVFVTRPKSNARFETRTIATMTPTKGAGFTVTQDRHVRLAEKCVRAQGSHVTLLKPS